MKTRHLASVAAVALVSLGFLGLPAVAQEQTGSIEGILTTEQGDPLPGVVVEVSGPRLVAKASAVSDARGRYRLPGLPSGLYKLTATAEGFTTATVPDFRLDLGAILTINIKMKVGPVEETIQVTSEAPVIEITQSATASSISDELITKLPRGRDFTSVVTQAAHAADESGAGGIAIDGASGSENRFIVDGIDTTFLISGTSGKDVNTDFVEEVQVKSSGYNAEYGGSTGGVISVVTKSGGNEFHGDASLYLRDRSWDGDERQNLRISDQSQDEFNQFLLPEDDDERIEPGFTLGGRLLRDRLWFFGGFFPEQREINRTVTFTSGVTRTFREDLDTDAGVFNLSGAFGNTRFKVGYNTGETARDNTLPGRGDAANPGAGSSDPDDFNVDQVRPNESFHGSLDWVASSNLFVSFRSGQFEYDTMDTGFSRDVWINFIGSPGVEFPGQVPPGLDRPNRFSTPSNSGNLFDNLQRTHGAVDVTYFANDLAGSHTFKAGYQGERIANEVFEGYTNTRILFYWDQSRTAPDGRRLRGTFGHYRPIVIATDGDVSANNSAIFVQDSWTLPNNRLTFNLGVRFEEEEVPSFATRSDIPEVGLDFGYGDKVAPRFGFAYDVKGDGNWKVYGSWGTFYDTMKLALARGSFGGEKWIDNFFALDTLDWQSIVDTCRVTDNRIDAPPPAGCPGDLLFQLDRRSAANDPNDSRIDPNLKPYESQEITVGAEHQLGPRTSVGVRYVHKELKRAIEDVGVLTDTAEVFFIANPGEGIAQNILGPEFPSLPRPVRDYDGIELDFRKRFSNRWMLHASYLYSRLVGNYSGLASSDEISNTTGLARRSPNVERFFDSLISSFDPNGNAVEGHLATDRPHTFKAQFIYDTPWNTTVGVNQFLASGTPISTQLDGPANNPFFPFGRGDLGRTPTLTETDLYLAHPFKLAPGHQLEVSLNILNLFDQDTETKFFTDRAQEAIGLNDEQFFAGFDPNETFYTPNPSDPAFNAAQEAMGKVPVDPRYNIPTVYQSRRTIRFNVRYRF